MSLYKAWHLIGLAHSKHSEQSQQWAMQCIQPRLQCCVVPFKNIISVYMSGKFFKKGKAILTGSKQNIVIQTTRSLDKTWKRTSMGFDLTRPMAACNTSSRAAVWNICRNNSWLKYNSLATIMSLVFFHWDIVANVMNKIDIQLRRIRVYLND